MSKTSTTVTSATVRASGLALLALTGLSLAGCNSGPSGAAGSGGGPSTSNILRNLVFFGGTQDPPPVAGTPSDEEFDCPPVEIAEGGATLRQGVDSDAVRVQLSIGQTARECRPTGPDGSFAMKVGVEALALIGAAGRPGQYDATIRFNVMRGQTVVATSAKRVGIMVPQGETRGSAVMVEDGLVVGPGDNKDLSLEIGLEAGGRGAASSRRRR